jgi:hypothetical protein
VTEAIILNKGAGDVVAASSAPVAEVEPAAMKMPKGKKAAKAAKGGGKKKRK